MLDLTAEMPALLATVQRPGEFYATGTAELPILRIAVDGVGLLGLPLTPLQGDALASVATPAPYGRGQQTVVDPEVRRCGQIPPSAVHLDDPRWHGILAGIVAAARTGLGVDGKVEAEFYKLLVYRPGDFFLPHRDSEKARGMFGTLVIVLPSEHVGGELVVQHDGRLATLDLTGDDLGVAHWAAFYADCQHELQPVRTGYRVALVYNLVRKKDAAPQAPDYRPEAARVSEVLGRWTAEVTEPVKLVVPLGHHYTLAELSFGHLKNRDAAVAAVLRRAAAEARCTLRLAMVSIVESGSAEPEIVRRGRQWRESTESYEVIEITERTATLDAWRRPDDSADPLGRIDLVDDELSPQDALDKEPPDEDHLHESTGNEGASFERTYRRAAFVLWPEARELEVMAQGSMHAQLAAIGQLPADRAVRFAHIVVANWPRPTGDMRYAGGGEQRARLLQTLTKLDDAGPLTTFLREVSGGGAFDKDDTAALVPALDRLSAADAGVVLAGIAAIRGHFAFEEVAALLRAVADQRPSDTLRPALSALVDVVAKVAEFTPWERSRIDWPAGLTDVLRATGAIRADDLALRLAREVLLHPELWPLDDAVLKIALALSPGRLASPATATLGEAAAAFLRARVAKPLTAPADLARDATGLHCTCRNCKSLREFMVHPTQSTWQLRAVETDRRHVELAVRNASLDADLRTDKRGSPYTLMLLKNQASYDRLVAQREADLTALRQLAVG